MTSKEKSSVILFTTVMMLVSVILAQSDSFLIRVLTIPPVVLFTGYFVSEKLIKGED